MKDKLRSETGDRFQPAGTNGSEKSRQYRKAKGPVSIQNKFSIRDISNARYGRKEGQCRGRMSTARYGRGKNNTGKNIWKNLPGKILYGALLPYWVGMQGLTTREEGLGAINTEEGGRLRAQRVSETCLVPCR